MSTAASGSSIAASGWRPNWDALADHIVNRTFRMRPAERVVYLADPESAPELLDAVREAVLRAGGIEQGSMLAWTPRLAEFRLHAGYVGETEAIRRERAAHLDLFNSADIFMWLPTGYFRGFGATTGWESEWISAKWRGRGLHFHWFKDEGSPPESPIHEQLERIYERAVLKLDYEALGRRQRRLVEAIRGKDLRVTTPAGTDLTFHQRRDAWYCCNDGDASIERSRRAITARDREEELPCGAVRTVPEEHSVNGVISLRGAPPWNGYGLDIKSLGDHLDVVFKDGHIAEVRGGAKQAGVDAALGKLRGQWDRLGEIVFGTNPLLETPAGARTPAYWGFGQGWFRLHLGDNVESGGTFHANLWINLFLSDTTVEADGEVILKNGRLLID